MLTIKKLARVKFDIDNYIVDVFMNSDSIGNYEVTNVTLYGYDTLLQEFVFRGQISYNGEIVCVEGRSPYRTFEKHLVTWCISEAGV